MYFFPISFVSVAPDGSLALHNTDWLPTDQVREICTRSFPVKVALMGASARGLKFRHREGPGEQTHERLLPNPREERQAGSQVETEAKL